MVKTIDGNEADSEALQGQSGIAVADTPRDLEADSVQTHPGTSPAPSASDAAQRWLDAKHLLAQHLSAAAFRAWVEPLELVSSLHGLAIRLRCSSAFQCEQVSRRYRAAIEEALGVPVELVVAP